MDYQQTIDYLFARLPMFSRIGEAAYKNDLTNTINLCNFLNNPQNTFKSIHVAGTNGKGSVSHMLSAIFQAAGYKTGLYTSPHLKDFRERIKLNHSFIEESFIVDFTSRIQPIIDVLEPSFFEITVAMAFEYFALQRVDIAIIEVGLGGRLDSTNVITPELSVITNIGFDHMNILGHTLPEIAFEKAGIIKENIPVIVGEKSDQVSEVFEKRSRALHARLSYADEHRFVSDWKFEKSELMAEVTTIHSNDKQIYRLDLTGIYQTKNLITVLDAVHCLIDSGWNILPAHIHKGLSSVKKATGLHGRWEVIHQHPTIVLDVAHNEDGITQLVQQIEITDHETIHIIIGMVKDKNVERILQILPLKATYYFTRANIPRALSEIELAQKAWGLGLAGNHYENVNVALQQALSQSTEKDLILVCGSVFLVGEVNTSIPQVFQGHTGGW